VTRIGAGLLLGSAAVACTGPAAAPPLDPRLSLAAAREVHETGALDIGTLEARHHLLEGWSRDERNGDGVTLAWGMGERSTLSLDVLVPRDLELWFRCWPFAPEDGVPQTLTAFLNGTPLGQLSLAAEAASYRLGLPAAALLAGTNELEFRYARSRRPSDLWPGSSDERSLAVAWDALELLGTAPRAPVREVRGALFVPHGNGLEFVFEAAPGTRFSAPELEGAGDLSLRARATTATGSRETRAAVGAGLDLALPLERAGWVALRLDAVWDGATPSSGQELRVVAPSLTGAALPPADVPPERSLPAPPNVLLYVVDTLRADHLGCYGHPGGLTPRIDALAAESVLFERTTAASAWTRTSMASILTGLPPLAHGANRRDQAVTAELQTLAERLREAGWDTAGFVTNPNLAPQFGFDQGFGRYALLEQADARLAYVPSGELNDAALAWLGQRDAPEPFFLYLHSMDPHDPYFAHIGDRPGRAGAGDRSEAGSILFMRAIEHGRIAPTPAIRRQLLELYASEIRYNDARIGELLDRLAARGLDRNTVVVLLSDHGEEFEDHGWWRHGKTLFEEMLHVPFLIRWPDRRHAGLRVGTRAAHVDVVPTLLELLGLPPAPGLPGRSLVPAVEGREIPRAPAPAYAWLDLDGRVVEAVVLDDWKLIRSLARARNSPSVALYDLGLDPSETLNRSAHPGAPLGLLSALIRNPRLAGRPTGARTEIAIDPQLEERLRAVGYLH
jgi:arylsulfatase A-like enzyme